MICFDYFVVGNMVYMMQSTMIPHVDMCSVFINKHVTCLGNATDVILHSSSSAQLNTICQNNKTNNKQKHLKGRYKILEVLIFFFLTGLLSAGLLLSAIIGQTTV